MNYRTSALPEGACPRCLQELVKHDVVGHRVDACGACGGVFVERATAEAIVHLDGEVVAGIFALSSGKKELSTTAVSEPTSCPRCSQAMLRTRITSAVCDIDTCLEHGTWFDAQEFHHVHHALRDARKKRGRR